MLPSEARQQGLTRPRPSLSCGVCRRRKVRCGKERPFCANCVKTPEVCKYDYDFHRPFPQEATTNLINGDTRGEAEATESTAQPSATSLPNSAVHQHTQSSKSHIPYDRTSTVVDPQLEDRAGSAYPLSPFSSENDRHGGGDRHPSQAHAANSSLTFAQTRPQANPSQEMPTWERAQSNAEDSRQRIDLPAKSNTIYKPTFEPPRKRHRSPEPLSESQERENDLEETQDPAMHKRKRTHPAAIYSSKSEIRPSGSLSMQRGGLSRFVANTFWGLVKGHEDLCETLITEKDDMPENVPPAHIDVSGMANLVTMMPNKAICDSLFGSFYLMVHPVHSLIHLPTFRTDYNNYWQWCRNSDISMPDNKLLSDPTFLCLMFSVLYCGATASPPELWSTGKLQGLQKEKTVENLRKTFSASLKMCQHLQYPTLATLTSSLLAHSCTESNVGHLEDLGFAHMTVRIAQSMGLHRDGSSFGLDPISCEMRRRVWWHVVWLDVQISMTHGSQVCLGTSESDSNVAMVSEISDLDLSSRMISLASRSTSPPPGPTSVAMLLTQARCETAKFKRSLATSFQSGAHIEQTQLDHLLSAAKSIQARLDHIIERIPSEGLLKDGSISSHIANASPQTHEWLYSDSIGEATVWGTWARLMIVMYRTEVAISVQKPFLERADSRRKQQKSMWNSITQLSITYLRNLLQSLQVPAFSPYTWFCKNCLPPFQSLFIILTYLQYNRDWHNGTTALSLADEVLDIFTSSDNGSSAEHGNADCTVRRSNERTPLVWRTLVSLRRKIDLPSGMERPPYKPVAPIRCQLASPALAQRKKSLVTNEKNASNPAVTSSGESTTPGSTESLPALPSADLPAMTGTNQVNGQGLIEADEILDMSDLDAWCSSLLQDPEALDSSLDQDTGVY